MRCFALYGTLAFPRASRTNHKWGFHTLRGMVAPSNHLLAPEVYEHPHGQESAQRQDGVEAEVPLSLGHVGEVHPVDAGYEGERQEDSRYCRQPLHALVYALGLLGGVDVQ